MTVFTSTLHDLIQKALRGELDSALLPTWIQLLRAAAEQSLPDEPLVRARLRQTLGARLRQATSPSRMAKTHPGIRRFTVGQLEPQFRNELDQRILASAELIKLNRRRRIDETLQRFSGWLSSVPPTGTHASKPRKAARDIAAPVVGTTMERHRVETDQGHKLVAAVSEILARQTDAVAGIWRSHGRHDESYDARPDHLARDGRVYVVRGSWADDARLVKHPNGYVDEITRPGEEINCRCWYVWLHGLSELPAELLTAKGHAALDAVRSANAG